MGGYRDGGRSDSSQGDIIRSTNYVTPNGTKFKGVTLEDIISDKISAISSRVVFRRMKDVVDIYRISMCRGIYIKDIINMIYLKELNLKDFKEFLHEEFKLKQAYDKLGRIENKPDFYTAYTKVRDF